MLLSPGPAGNAQFASAAGVRVSVCGGSARTGDGQVALWRMFSTGAPRTGKSLFVAEFFKKLHPCLPNRFVYSLMSSSKACHFGPHRSISVGLLCLFALVFYGLGGSNSVFLMPAANDVWH